MNTKSTSSNYKFSIITAVYNTEAYLHESIDSVLNQTLGLSNVQLILVNDGSTDSSLDICYEYQNKYPNNIIVLSKENGGPSSARNLGLEYATGEYLNFLDSDDKLKPNALEEVYKFFKSHKDEIDVVSIQVMLFEAENRGHYLNYKYKKQRVVDLVKEPNYPQLFVNSTFIKREAFTFRFDNRIVNSEDALLINKILLKKQKIGYVNKTQYLYRKRNSHSSLLDTRTSRKDFFNKRLKYYFMELINYSLENYPIYSLNNEIFIKKQNSKTNIGKSIINNLTNAPSSNVPRFIQYVLAYDLQWVVSVNSIEELLNEDEIKEFWELFIQILSYIDDDIIIHHKSMDDEYKRFLLAFKYVDNDFSSNNKIDFDKIYDKLFIENEKGKFLYNNVKFNLNNYSLCSGGIIVDSIKDHTIWIDLISLKDNYIEIFGFFSSNFDDNLVSVDVIEITKKLNKTTEKIFKTTKVNYSSRNLTKRLDVSWSFMHNFIVKIPYNKDAKYKFKVNLHSNFEYSFILPINFTAVSRLSNMSNYHIVDSKMLVVKKDALSIKNYSFIKMVIYELQIIIKIFFEKGPYYTSAIPFRLLYLVLYPFMKNKRIFIFMDRRESAGDNGEALFKYAINQDDNIKKVFAVNITSTDYNRLNNIVPVLKNSSIFNNQDELVPYYSIKHRILYLFAEKVISSHPDHNILNPFSNKNTRYYNGLFTSKTYFLQHGVTKDNISHWLRRYDKDLDLILTVSDLEAQSFTDEGYFYDKKIIQTLGFPRFDYLDAVPSLNDNVLDGSLNYDSNLTLDELKEYHLNYDSNLTLDELKEDYKELNDDFNNNKPKFILLAPSWRNYLFTSEDLINSDYYKEINALLSDKKFMDSLRDKGYKIIFKPHPKLLHFIKYFNTSNVILDLNKSYNELFKSSDLLITDYSSVAFDFAYLNKPVIYYQYKKDYNFDLDKSYFDYNTMGFGKVIKQLDDLKITVLNYVNNNCIMEEVYKNRVNNFFKFKDKNNSKRVYEWILEN